MSGILLSSLYAAEPVLIAVALFVLLRSKSGRRFNALVVYLTLRLVSFFVLEAVFHADLILHVSRHTIYFCYFYTYWPLYIASAVSVFFVILELFKFALEPLPGLKRLGLVAFRWVACVSCVAAAAAAVVPGVRKNHMLLIACDQLMRCESIFLLSLLFFLLVCAGKLGLSYRSQVFGISVGFGIMATSNLVASAFLLSFNNGNNIATSAISIMDTAATLLTLAIWTGYFRMQEPARRPIALAVTSSLARWNEVAMALTPSVGQVAFATPSRDFFLQDVEKVVDRILTKNSLNAAS